MSGGTWSSCSDGPIAARIAALRDGLDIGGRQTIQAPGQLFDRDVQMDGAQALSHQPLTVGLPGQADLDFLAEASAAENSGVNPVQMVGRGNQEDVMFRRQVADLRSALLNELCVVWVHQVGRPGHETVNFVEEDN
jgi:hypothetical protein